MNPITDFSASEFLLFYGTAIVVVLVGAWWHLRPKGSTRSNLAPTPEGTIDPYELAYMRGGENEAARVIIVSLAEQGYLEVLVDRQWWRSDEKTICQTSVPPEPGSLSAMETTVYDSFAEAPRTGADVFASDLPQLVGSYCLGFEERLQQRGLLATEAECTHRLKAKLIGAAIIGMIGAGRLIVAIGRDEPFGFLVLTSIVGFAALAGLCRTLRLSSTGRDYLKQLQEASAQLVATNGTRYALAVALFGTSALANTPYAHLGEEFEQGASVVAGGCGAGCDGGGGGDGGCGGCGGCGG